MGEEVIMVRETEAPPCPACGSGGGSWELGILLSFALLAIFEDPALLEPLFSRACDGCRREATSGR